MCIIFHSIGKDNLPTLSQLKQMQQANPDGGGFAYCIDDQWKVIKGVCLYKNWKDELTALYKELSKASEVIGHFRLATHGAVNKNNCHPFRVNRQLSISQECRKTIDGVLFHNGILHAYGSKHLSDTLDFTCSTVAMLADRDRKALLDSVNGLFAYIDTKGTVSLHGKFIEHVDGFKMSNDYWEPNYFYRTGNGYLDNLTPLDDEFMESGIILTTDVGEETN